MGASKCLLIPICAYFSQYKTKPELQIEVLLDNLQLQSHIPPSILFDAGLDRSVPPIIASLASFKLIARGLKTT